MNEANITPLNYGDYEVSAEAEIFVELEKYHGYYISNYGRLYSKRSNKLLVELLKSSGRTKGLRPAYSLPDEKGTFRQIRTSKLVASVFLDRSAYPDGVRTVVHHKSSLNSSRVSDLEIMSIAEHNVLHCGVPVYLLNNDTCEFEKFATQISLSRYLGIKHGVILRALERIRNGKMIATLDGYNLVDLRNTYNEKGERVYIGYREPDKTDKLDSVTIVSLMPELIKLINN